MENHVILFLFFPKIIYNNKIEQRRTIKQNKWMSKVNEDKRDSKTIILLNI